MKGLIKEMLRSGLMENERYADNDMIDFSDINLNWEFNRLNNLLFDGKCIPVPLELSRRRTAHGHVSATIDNFTGKITVKKLAISKFYNVPYKLFKDTFAHEMIHVYLLQQNINDGHGSYFHREMNRINGMGLGFNVSVKLDSGDLEVSSNVKGKHVIFLVFSTDGGSNKKISVMEPSLYYGQGNRIAQIYSHVINNGKYKEFNGTFYESSNPLLRGFKVQRTFNNGISNANVSDDFVNKVLQGSKEISTLYVNGKEVKWDGNKPNNVGSGLIGFE